MAIRRAAAPRSSRQRSVSPISPPWRERSGNEAGQADATALAPSPPDTRWSRVVIEQAAQKGERPGRLVLFPGRGGGPDGVDDRGVRQGGRVTKRLPIRDVPQQAPHDLAGPRLGE